MNLGMKVPFLVLFDSEDFMKLKGYMPLISPY